jgi:hypothetical protein
MSGTALTEIQLQQPGDKSYLFQKGHPRYGGRRKGARNRFGGDLREEIVAAIKETGFIQKDEKGELVGTGKDGCKGFIKWLALHEPKTAAALFARVLPYFINVSGEARSGIRSRDRGSVQGAGLAARADRALADRASAA